MLRTVLPALIDTTGVLNATALAGILRGTEILLVFVIQVTKESYDQAYEYDRSGQEVFHDTPHSVLPA
jgi:hypothetical protein